MEGTLRDATLAQVAVSAVRIRGVHVVPVRHHSPALARATAAVIRALRPRLVLIEGPSDANHLLDALVAPDAVAPLAILAYRQPQARQASADLAPQVVFYPLCDYSPELVALRTARELGIEARFCDIPAAATLEHQSAEPSESSPAAMLAITAQSEKTAAQSEKIAAQSEKIAAQSEKIVMQSEKIVMQHEKIATQSEKIAAQSEKIAAQSEKIVMQSEKIVMQHEKIATQSEKISPSKVEFPPLPEVFSPLPTSSVNGGGVAAVRVYAPSPRAGRVGEGASSLRALRQERAVPHLRHLCTLWAKSPQSGFFDSSPRSVVGETPTLRPPLPLGEGAGGEGGLHGRGRPCHAPPLPLGEGAGGEGERGGRVPPLPQGVGTGGEGGLHGRGRPCHALPLPLGEGTGGEGERGGFNSQLESRRSASESWGISSLGVLADGGDAPTPQADANLYTRVAQRMGFDDHEEWWECLFEIALRDPSVLLQRTLEWGQLVIGETGISEYDALRNAFMWKQVEDSGVPPEQVVLVVGAAHAAAFADPDFHAHYDPDHPLLKARPAEFVLTPYSFPRLSEQLGYGAGNRAPQFYQDAWERGSLDEATLATLTRLVNAMKMQGDVASHADAIEAYRLAKQLASLRGKPQPGYRETLDAAIAAFGRGQAERVETPLRRLMLGERVGRAPQSATQPPVQAEFYRLAHELRLPVKDEPTDLRLNLAEPHAVQQSIFLHRLAVAKIPFADLQSSEAATYGQMARLREKWRLQWTPLTDVALAEAVIWGNTLREVAKRKIEPRLTQREPLAQVSAAALEAVLCELPELYDVALQALDEASIRDGDFVSLARAAYQIAGLIEYGAARAVQQAMFEPLLQRVYTRACLHLLQASDCGEDEARAVGEAMQLLHELAHKLPYLETDLWRENLRETVLSERAQAYVVGLGLGLLGFLRTEDEPLWLRARRMLSPATPPEQAAGFLEGLLQAQGGAAARARPFVQAMHEFVMSLPDEQFIQALPMLRRAFSGLSNHDIHYLTENLLRIVGAGVAAQVAIETESLLTREEVEHIWAQLAWLG